MRAGDIVRNPLTGEKAMLVDTAGDRLVAAGLGRLPKRVMR